MILILRVGLQLVFHLCLFRLFRCPLQLLRSLSVVQLSLSHLRPQNFLFPVLLLSCLMPLMPLGLAQLLSRPLFRLLRLLLQSLSCLQSMRSCLTTLFGPALPGVNFGQLTRNIMVGTTSFEYDRFAKCFHSDIERPSETLARVETKKLPPGVPAKFPGTPGLQFCLVPVLHLDAVCFCCCFGLPPLFGGRDSTPRQVWWTGSPSIPLCCDMFSGFC